MKTDIERLLADLENGGGGDAFDICGILQEAITEIERLKSISAASPKWSEDSASRTQLKRKASERKSEIDRLEELVRVLDYDRAKLQSQVPIWIPVSERLPKERQGAILLIAKGYSNAQIGLYEGTNEVPAKRWWSYNGYLCPDSVTHWMPLPQFLNE